MPRAQGPRKTCKVSGCGRQFTPRRGTRREKCFECSPEKDPGGPESMTPPAGPAALPTNGEMAAAVAAELERLDRAGTVAGAIAMRLARTLDDPRLGAAQVSSIAAQLTRTLEPLQRHAPRSADALDEIAARREAKAASA
jgi:hypothetical protein